MEGRPRTWIAIAVVLSLVILSGSAIAEEKKDKNAEKRAEIDAMAKKALDTVLAKSENAKQLHAKAAGYAVFNNVKVAIGISGGGGSGVAVSKSGQRTYMKMGTAGIGLGLGGQKYQVVFFFETDAALKSFVEKGWKAEGSAQAAAGNKGADAGASFSNGMALYQLTDAGLMASADVSGTKYWKYDKLNK